MTAPSSWKPGAREALKRLDNKLFADTREASVILDVDPRTLRRAIIAGDIPAVRAGANWRVPVAWLREQAGVS